LRLPDNATLASQLEPDLLGGVIPIKGNATIFETAGWPETLYRTEPPRRSNYSFTAIPYYAWEQREPGEMRSWRQAEA
jgi:DUF1680 family protein